ncbi:unnamed protein product [Schistosoma mattheei]|uniref:Uncharacterized protein n=1 Tax=Schistosoma mattheei TaxID=31246 RepID=A0A183NFA0_9TREM|nr:unnamed protein product [Schistosoma mattheei]
MLLYYDHEEKNTQHTQRVAVMLSKEARNTLVVWESHGSRIMKAPLETKKEGITMNIIECYAPTNDSNDDNKDQFYERLQSIVAKCSSLCISRPQHTQRKKQHPQIQHREHQPNHTSWRNYGKCEILHLPGKHHR